MRIELPDDIGAALTAKAAAQGLTLENWFQQLAILEPSGRDSGQSGRRRYSLSDLLAQCDMNAPTTAEDDAWLNAHAIGREAL